MTVNVIPEGDHDVVSTLNSSTALLAGGGNFPGASESSLDFESITVYVTSDQPGTVTLKTSTDGVTFETPASRAYPGGSIGQGYTFIPISQFFEISYANTGLLQTVFRMQTIKRRSGLGPINARLDEAVTDASLALRVKAVLAGKYATPTPAVLNAYTNVPVNLLGYSFTTAEEFLRDVALGRVPGHSLQHVVGANDGVGTVDEEVWNPSAAHVLPTAAAVVSIVSTALVAFDGAAGTGVRTLRVDGLDASYNPLSETVTVNGTTPVLTTGLFLRVSAITAVTVGSTGAAVGTITATVTAALQAQIDAGETQSFNGFFTVPLGKTALLVRESLSAGPSTASNFVEVDFQVRDAAANSPFLSRQSLIVAIGSVSDPNEVASAKIAEKSDIRYLAKGNGGTALVRVAADYLLVDNALVA